MTSTTDHGAGAERMDRDAVADRLRQAGCVAADAEADELLHAAVDGVDDLSAMVDRRCTGEPLAWIVGSTVFCGERIVVDPGVYVPRPQTEALARRATELMAADGIACDVCCGSGAIAVVLRSARPGSTVLAFDADPLAVACARRNGVDAAPGDLLAALDPMLAGRLDVVVGVVPYVPTDALALLPRDVLDHEDQRHYDGGPGGIALLRRLVEQAAAALRPGGSLLLELGGDQAMAIAADLERNGFVDLKVHVDEEGDARAIEARR